MATAWCSTVELRSPRIFRKRGANIRDMPIKCKKIALPNAKHRGPSWVWRVTEYQNFTAFLHLPQGLKGKSSPQLLGGHPITSASPSAPTSKDDRHGACSQQCSGYLAVPLLQLGGRAL